MEGVSVEHGKTRWRLGDDYRSRTDSRLYINMSSLPHPEPPFICLSFVSFTNWLNASIENSKVITPTLPSTPDYIYPRPSGLIPKSNPVFFRAPIIDSNNIVMQYILHHVELSAVVSLILEYDSPVTQNFLES